MVGYACMMHKCFLDTNLGSLVIKLMPKGFILFLLFFSFLITPARVKNSADCRAGKAANLVQ